VFKEISKKATTTTTTTTRIYGGERVGGDRIQKFYKCVMLPLE
jgi:hypothetical protein